MAGKDRKRATDQPDADFGISPVHSLRTSFESGYARSSGISEIPRWLNVAPGQPAKTRPLTKQLQLLLSKYSSIATPETALSNG